MCLEKPVNKEPCKEGYKVFTKFDNHITSDIRGHAKLPVGEWLDEKDYRCVKKQEYIFYNVTNYHGCNDCKYPMGWHVFHGLKGAKQWVSNSGYSGIKTIRKVMVEEPVVVGTQEDWGSEKLLVTVCKKIKILEETK